MLSAKKVKFLNKKLQSKRIKSIIFIQKLCFIMTLNNIRKIFLMTLILLEIIIIFCEIIIQYRYMIVW